MPDIYEDIQQQRRFERPEQEAVVTLLRTADVLRHALDRALAPWRISPEQYNVLRILRGAKEAGHPTLAVAERMISRSPNITRLLDKLVARGLATRRRDAGDRRVATVAITDEGRTLLRHLDGEVGRVLERASCLSTAQIRSLVSMLDLVRQQLAVLTRKEALSLGVRATTATTDSRTAAPRRRAPRNRR